jgi:hypothetical protein
MEGEFLLIFDDSQFQLKKLNQILDDSQLQLKKVEPSFTLFFIKSLLLSPINKFKEIFSTSITSMCLWILVFFSKHFFSQIYIFWILVDFA